MQIAYDILDPRKALSYFKKFSNDIQILTK